MNQEAKLSEIVIQAQIGWVPVNLREIWDYRYMIYFMVVRNLKAAYEQSVLGPLWILINNFISVVIYSLFFGVVADLPTNGIPYPIFTFVGLMPWTLFSSTASGVTASMANTMIKKVYFPRLTIPLIRLVNNLVDFFISALLLVFMLIYYHYTPTVNVVFLPLFTLIAIALSLGIGLISVPFEVRSRDTRHVMGYITRFWFYATPVVYALDALPEQWRYLAWINPLTPVVEGYRWALLGTAAPPTSLTLYSLVVSIVVLYIGLVVFKRDEHNFADLI